MDGLFCELGISIIQNSSVTLFTQIKKNGLQLSTMKRLYPLLLLLCFFQWVAAQHHSSPMQPSHKKTHFRISASLAHTYLPEYTIDGKKTLVLPSFGLDLEAWFNPKWGIGLHNDLELLTFEVKDQEGLHIEREFPVLLTMDLLWKPIGKWVFFCGPGLELEPSQNYFVLRMGTEYEISISEHWDITPICFYDFRINAYNTFSIGLGVGYFFDH